MAQEALIPALVALTTLAAGSLGPAASAPARGDAIVNSLGMRMVLVPAGTFRMGSPPGEPLRQEEEVPRRVTLTRAFRIASTEVTLRQWLALMPPAVGAQQEGELPITSISWKEAQEFCVRLSRKEGARYRLPTEAEWECACRAGATVPPADRAAIETASWYADNSGGMAHPVGQKGPNAWGLFDMLGNAAEWTSDAYGPYPRVDEDRDPAGPSTGSTKVVRGGSWRAFLPALRCAARTGLPESYQLPHVGLRVVMEVVAHRLTVVTRNEADFRGCDVTVLNPFS